MSDPTRVMIVDDHRLFADALERLLADEEGVHVVGAVGSGEEALALAAAQPVPVTVALVDLDLPGMDGVETTRRLRESSADTQVVIVTAATESEDVVRALEAGACGYVRKTQAPDLLVDTIRKAAVGDIVLPPGRLAPMLEALRGASPAATQVAKPDFGLTPRELEVLKCMSSGMSTREMAAALFVSENTVLGHVKNILWRLGVNSKLKAVSLALAYGSIAVPSPDEVESGCPEFLRP